MTHTERWPELPFHDGQDTCETLHLWTQVVGKIRLARTPWIHHSWHTTLHRTSRGLTTSPVADGTRTFEIRFDLAVTRCSGRTAREHPGGFPNLPDWVTRGAYSHEVGRCGSWPGNRGLPEPLSFSYAYPAPSGFGEAPVRPAGAHSSPELGGSVFPYERMREADVPEAALFDFLQSAYEAAADLGGWPREAVERAVPVPPRSV